MRRQWRKQDSKDVYKGKNLGITCEKEGPRIPPGSGKVVRMFKTVYGGFRAILNGVGLQKEIRSGIWAECIYTATFY
jgi:hypothetical protein